LSNQVHIPNTDYFITDFSSINEPTLTQNKHCIIPFVYNNVKYDYCAYIFGKFQCKIDNIKNSFDNCYSNGSFLYGRTSNNGDKFESTYKSKVNINYGIGKYQIKFHVLMYCSSQNCLQAQDYIKFNINLINNKRADYSDSFIKIDLNNIDETNKWIEKALDFDVYDLNIKNLSIDVNFGRMNKTNDLTYFGFDNLQIVYKGQSSLLTTKSGFVPFN
jgi:hypothetical protein